MAMSVENQFCYCVCKTCGIKNSCDPLSNMCDKCNSSVNMECKNQKAKAKYIHKIINKG